MKVGLLFDGASADAATPDMAILGTVAAVEEALASEGNTIVRVPVHPDARWIDRLRRANVDLVFNLCESIDGVAALEPPVISVLELLGIPYTGSSSWTTALCLRKHIVNGALERAGLPIPRFAVVRRGSAMPSVGFPAICKPAAEDASIGVEQRSVVRTSRELAERVDAMLDRWDEVLVQRYVDGREVNVGILGDAVLPIAEIDFGHMPRGMWRIISYRSKWQDGSDEDLGAAPRCPARLPASVASQVRKMAVAAWRIAGGSGYGRVDMRIDERGRPWILEVNSNPDIAPDAGLARMARVAGVEYGQMIRQVCEHGLHRARTAGTTAGQWALAQRLSGVAMGEPAPDLFRGTGHLMHLTPLTLADRARVTEVLVATRSFSGDEIGVALELFDETYASEADGAVSRGEGSLHVPDYEFVGARDDAGVLHGYACFGPTPDTHGTWDMYWLAVHPGAQGRGTGRALVHWIERELAARGARLVVVETSSRPDYAGTRAFYARGGYVEAARVRDFYGSADDRIILTTRLTAREGGAATQ